ncbi:hypothetical protein ACTFSP_09745 [Bacillus cereus group sp. MYBK108-2]|uniref:hypothetical protein n=1 Tax=unclassified Bacillus cereus group TaxID=2750818 RepID=UPI003F79E2BE
MDVLEFLGAYGLGTAGISTVIVYLSKQVFLHKMKNLEENHKNELNKELKRLEAEFKALTDRQIEDHKSELKKINDKYHITFSKLHEGRADTIKELYAMLVELEKSVESLTVLFELKIRTDIIPNTSEMGEKYHKFRSYYMENKIYFAEPTCELIDTIIIKYVEVIANYDVYGHAKPDSETKKLFIQENLNSVKKEIPLLKKNLENEFRKLLGVIDEK